MGRSEKSKVKTPKGKEAKGSVKLSGGKLAGKLDPENGVPDNGVNKQDEPELCGAMRKSTRSVKLTEKAATNLPLVKKRKSEVQAAEQEGEKSAKTIAKANVRVALKGGKIGKAKSDSRERNSPKSEAAAAKFVDEEETEFLIEVEGQASEFMSDPEEENEESDQRGSSQSQADTGTSAQTDSDSEGMVTSDDDDEPDYNLDPEILINNNATKSTQGWKQTQGWKITKTAMVKEGNDADEVPQPLTSGGNSSRNSMPFEFQQFSDFMQQWGLMLVEANTAKNCTPAPPPQTKGTPGKRIRLGNDKVLEIDNNSEATIYKLAVPPVKGYCNSSSSEDDMQLDTSDEIDNLAMGNIALSSHVNQVELSLPIVGHDDGIPPVNLPGRRQSQEPWNDYAAWDCQVQRQPVTPEYSRAKVMVREAERSRAWIYEVQGKTPEHVNNEQVPSENNCTPYLPVLDEDYLMVGNHMDENLKKKIVEGEYVDFAKLMPRDKILFEEDQCMEMVNKGGISYWVPLSEREVTSITNFFRWEQAFRVFSNIYTERYPGKAGELIQYNHVFHTASQTFS